VLSIRNADLEMRFKKPVRSHLYLGKSLPDAVNVMEQRAENVESCCSAGHFVTETRPSGPNRRSFVKRIRPQRESLRDSAGGRPISYVSHVGPLVMGHPALTMHHMVWT